MRRRRESISKDPNQSTHQGGLCSFQAIRSDCKSFLLLVQHTPEVSRGVTSISGTHPYSPGLGWRLFFFFGALVVSAVYGGQEEETWSHDAGTEGWCVQVPWDHTRGTGQQRFSLEATTRKGSAQTGFCQCCKTTEWKGKMGVTGSVAELEQVLPEPEV